MAAKKCAGYSLIESLPTTLEGVQHWRAQGEDGDADVYIGDGSLRDRAGSLPKWGPFAKFKVGEDEAGVHVIVPGSLARNLNDLGSETTPEVAMGVALHIATAVAELHERGGSHGGLHPEHVGVDASGRLVIRPYLGGVAIAEPDPEASAQATDCLHCATLLDGLQIDRLDDTSVSLVSRGLRRDIARRRIQPGRAVRQSLSAVLHRLPDWEEAIADVLGAGWGLDDTPWEVRADEAEALHVEVAEDPSAEDAAVAEAAEAAAAEQAAAEAAAAEQAAAEAAAAEQAAAEAAAAEQAAAEAAAAEAAAAEQAAAEAAAAEAAAAEQAAAEAAAAEAAAAEQAAAEQAAAEAAAAAAEQAAAEQAAAAAAAAEAAAAEAAAAEAAAAEAAAEQAAAEAAAAKKAAASPQGTRARTAAPAQPTAPTPSSADTADDALSNELPSTTDAVPRWLGARGVTNTSEREEELGLGKWTEVSDSVRDFTLEMDSAPVRELEIEEAGLPWVRLIIALGVLMMVGWYLFGDSAEGEVSQAADQNPRTTTAQPDIPRVTVDTQPPGARVYLEGVDYGLAPTAVPVPTDDQAHELCVIYKGTRTCRSLTGEALAFEDPYRFIIGGE